VFEKQENAFDKFCRISGRIIVVLLATAPFIAVGLLFVMFGGLWELVLLSGGNSSGCDEVGVSAVLVGIMILGLGFWVMGGFVFRATALHRGFSPWSCAYFILALFLVGGLPIAYGLGTDATCNLHG
jgi:hypothetical protein